MKKRIIRTPKREVRTAPGRSVPRTSVRLGSLAPCRKSGKGGSGDAGPDCKVLVHKGKLRNL